MSLHRVTDPRVDAEDIDSRRNRVDLADLALEVRAKLESLETLAADAQRLARAADERAKVNAGLLELLGSQVGGVQRALGELSARLSHQCGPMPGWDDAGEITRARVLSLLDAREDARDARALRTMRGGAWKIWVTAVGAAVIAIGAWLVRRFG